MSKTPLILCAAVAVALSLAACGEQNTSGTTPRKADAKAWQGTDGTFAAAGWKPSDAAAWQEQLRVRAQAQNEYNRVR
jgi:hypothetical protein